MMFDIKVGIRVYVCSDNGVEINYFELEALLMRIVTKEEKEIYLWKKIIEDKYIRIYKE